VVVVDPGPGLGPHVRAVAAEVSGAHEVTLLLTHGHGDHAGAVDALLELLPGASVAGAGHPRARALGREDRVETDAGTLRAIPTPGHTRDHLSFFWEEESALFPGDMVLGVGDTTWVAEYPGCVADWLASLGTLEAMEIRTVYPAHGPDVEDPSSLWRRYRAHREGRIARVRRALAEAPGAAPEVVLDRVYGDTIPPGLRPAAMSSLAALMEYVRDHPEGMP